jgi:hypothetical protein
MKWMQGLRTAAAAAALALSTVPAWAASGRVAVIPAYVTKGAPGNGRMIDNALRASLEKEGFTVTATRQVESELRARRLAPARRLTVMDLARLRDALHVDYVVYPRVLSAGLGVNGAQPQANVLVNVAGKSRSSFVHTRQVGQKMELPADAGTSAVMSRDESDDAVDKLMGPWYAKVR